MTAPPAYLSPAALLRKHGLRPQKSWGQNFLADPGILDQIAAAALDGLPVPTRIVELGAGLGHLTERLVTRGAAVVAVERDERMARVLDAELGKRIELRRADAAHLDLHALAAPASRIALAGNLPYHLTSSILFQLLDQIGSVSQATFLVQREVAERIAAKAGTREAGLLSVLLQREGSVELLFTVPARAFLPPPRVESAVMQVRVTGPMAPVTDVGRFRALVKAGFGLRRKTLQNALRSANLASDSALGEALVQAGIDPIRRGETLTVPEWAALERALTERVPR